jgi:hypothetical protein
MRIALVQEQRLAVVGGDLQLAFERAALRRPRRIVAVVVQAAFADREDLRRPVQFAQLGVVVVAVFVGVVRMHAGGRIKEARVGTGDFQRLPGALAAGAGHHHPDDACFARTREHGGEIVRETLVAQVGADVDQVHGIAHENPAAILVERCGSAAGTL